jgi:hypothetical protein
MRKRGNEIRASIISGTPLGRGVERPRRKKQPLPRSLQKPPGKRERHVMLPVALVHRRQGEKIGFIARTSLSLMPVKLEYRKTGK